MPHTLRLSLDCVLLAADQQYGFPVNAGQRASVTLTPQHSAPSDSTPRPECGPAECLISAGSEFLRPSVPSCLSPSGCCSLNGCVDEKAHYSNSLIYSTVCLYKQLPTPFLLPQLNLLRSFPTVISVKFVVFLFLMVLLFLFFILYHFDFPLVL